MWTIARGLSFGCKCELCGRGDDLEDPELEGYYGKVATWWLCCVVAHATCIDNLKTSAGEAVKSVTEECLADLELLPEMFQAPFSRFCP